MSKIVLVYFIFATVVLVDQFMQTVADFEPETIKRCTADDPPFQTEYNVVVGILPYNITEKGEVKYLLVQYIGDGQTDLIHRYLVYGQSDYLHQAEKISTMQLDYTEGDLAYSTKPHRKLIGHKCFLLYPVRVTESAFHKSVKYSPAWMAIPIWVNLNAAESALKSKEHKQLLNYINKEILAKTGSKDRFSQLLAVLKNK